ncbi:high frequency lysogenization protein HflD [Pseudoxanthomonas mexicana]|uniref:high frequency lysogenization protein HflD n=1 Tax=Pseudoxanthomonas mexicana TaxID=128785 RepID=UPI00398B36B2
MINRFSERVLALAGLAQALQQVRRIAETGQSDPAVVQASLDSVFRIDADSPLAVYGRVADVSAGLRLLRGYLANEARDEALPKLALSVLQLERRFVREDNTVDAVGNGIGELSAQARALGATHPEVLAALGGLYADTISHLRPRVMVQGNPHYLAQPGVVAEIRAILLAAVRSAVLWRQLGGSYWDFLLSRKPMLEAVDGWLRG